MRTFVTIILFLISLASFSQAYRTTGVVLDENGSPVSSAGAVLLDPADSTMLYFSVTAGDGRFAMKNIKRGSFLLQISLIGYNTLYRSLSIQESEDGDLGRITLTPKVYDVEGVIVSADRIPIKIKDDTIEYDARAFRVKPDAVAEELLKKLPGVEVDRAGNIKAMGEDVKNVLVDGKEFFGSDPKVATKNLPADAINKVQLYDKASDESAFSGIDDGERNPTINLVLDENKKRGVFGDISASAGSENHIAGSGKIYRFTEKQQFAALGMYNNINQYGFSMNDYITFSGGIQSFSSGEGHVRITNDNFPVNFGQPVYGTGSNGAAGVNFSISGKNKDRLFASYIGSGSVRNLEDMITTYNYLPDATFRLAELQNQVKRDTSHRFNFGIRKLLNDRQNLILNGNLTINSASNPLNLTSESYMDVAQVNSGERVSDEILSRISGNSDLQYLLKINEGQTLLKLSARASVTGSRSESRFTSRTEFYNPYSVDSLNQFYNLRSYDENYAAGVNITRRVSDLSLIEVAVNGSFSSELLNRSQGDITTAMISTEELSPDFRVTDRRVRPSIAWKRSTTLSQLSIVLQATGGRFSSYLNDDTGQGKDYFYLTPRASWEYEYRTGRRLMLEYQSSVSIPSADRLLPVVNNLNPLALFYGNRNLSPEYSHNGRISWWLFDQFSFTTLLSSLDITYTGNQVSYAREVGADLGQVISPINVKYGFNAGGDIDFTTVVKPLGIRANLVLSEEFNRGIGLVNDIENVTTGFRHRFSLTIDNRKKEKWDVETGLALSLSDSRFSVQNSMNNKYSDLSWFAEVRYVHGSHFSITGTADITSYSASTFNESALVPLLGAEADYYFLKNLRGTLTLSATDLLNRNSGIVRSGDLNYLTEKRSSIIGRYFLLSFKYRLNKTGNNSGGIDVQVRRR